MNTTFAERQYVSLINNIRETNYVSYPTKGEVLSVIGSQIVLLPYELPLLSGRKMHWKGLVGEIKAFVANATTNEEFKSHGCNFWGAWANEDGTLDVDYARLLHDFNGRNQLKYLIKGIKQQPHSRKHIISLWDPSSMAKQVPCVLSYQWIVRGNKLHMIWTQRSADVMVGLASDMFTAWLFNMLIARTVGLEAGTVTMNIADAHIYKQHLSDVGSYLQGVMAVDSEAKEPKIRVEGDIWDFEVFITDYKPAQELKFELLV